MARLENFFGRFKAEKPDAATTAQIKAWSRELLELPDDTAFAVNEIICRDPACPGMETVILVMEPGRKTQAYKIAKSLADITRDDIRDATKASA